MDKTKLKIQLLGHKGMLGHMVHKYLLGEGYKVTTTERRFPDKEFKTVIKESSADVLINCIGAIPQRTTDFNINWELPIWLDTHYGGKIIHPGTDCEMDDDDYGTSKRRAAYYILDEGKRTKILKASVIGPELKTNVSLLEWFLSRDGEIYGYTQAIWNGVTTLEWAKQCEILIKSWESSPILTVLSSDKNSKYELLKILQECYQKEDVSILPKELGKDKTLQGSIRVQDIKDQIQELIDYEKESNTRRTR